MTGAERKKIKECAKISEKATCSFCNKPIGQFNLCVQSIHTPAVICDTCVIRSGERMFKVYSKIYEALCFGEVAEASYEGEG